MNIHPTALIDPTAELAAGVTIGPYSIVGAGVVIGPGTVLHSHVVLHSGTRLGSNNTVHAGAVIGGWPQDLGFQPDTVSTVEIGDRNTIREHVTIHRGARAGGVTRVGNDCFLMAGSHLGHDTQIASHVILANHCLLAGHVQIGHRVFMGGGSVVHQFTRIGDLAIVQGISGLGKDLPPFCLAAGVNRVAGMNVVGMRRAGFDAARRAEIKDAFALVYRSGLNRGQALEKAAERTWSPDATAFFTFIAASKRGICPLGRRSRGSSSDEM